MDNKKLIEALLSLSVETGSLACLGCGYEHSCGIHGCAILRQAAEVVSDLRQQLAEKDKQITAAGEAMPARSLGNKALTVEELRGMDREPVWCESVHRHDGEGWYLVDATAVHPYEFIAVGRERGVPVAGITSRYWTAYRRPPEKME